MEVLHKQSKEKQLESLESSSRLEFVLAYLPLVLAVRSHYEETPEALAAGVVGLLTAYRKYDRSKSYKFSTYATYFIKEAIEEFLDKQNTA